MKVLRISVVMVLMASCLVGCSSVSNKVSEITTEIDRKYTTTRESLTKKMDNTSERLKEEKGYVEELWSNRQLDKEDADDKESQVTEDK